MVTDGENTATAIVSFASSNTTSLSVTLGSETKTVPAGSGEVTFARSGITDLPVSLKDNGTELASAVSKADCSSNASYVKRKYLSPRAGGAPRYTRAARTTSG